MVEIIKIEEITTPDGWRNRGYVFEQITYDDDTTQVRYSKPTEIRS